MIGFTDIVWDESKYDPALRLPRTGNTIPAPGFFFFFGKYGTMLYGIDLDRLFI